MTLRERIARAIEARAHRVRAVADRLAAEGEMTLEDTIEADAEVAALHQAASLARETPDEPEDAPEARS